MCNWRNADHREGAHNVEAVRLGRGKGLWSFASLCFLGGDIGTDLFVVAQRISLYQKIS